MPIYVYVCKECGKKFQALKNIADRHNAICECGKVPELVISFNGSIQMGSNFRFFADNGEFISDRKRVDRDPRPVEAGGYEKRL